MGKSHAAPRWVPDGYCDPLDLIQLLSRDLLDSITNWLRLPSGVDCLCNLYIALVLGLPSALVLMSYFESALMSGKELSRKRRELEPRYDSLSRRSIDCRAFFGSDGAS